MDRSTHGSAVVEGVVVVVLVVVVDVVVVVVVVRGVVVVVVDVVVVVGGTVGTFTQYARFNAAISSSEATVFLENVDPSGKVIVGCPFALNA